jgi:ubiquinone/menaquinone biosynthesis C-methylase UbiE
MSDTFIDKKIKLFDRWSFWYDNLFPTIFYQAIHQRLLEYVRLPERAKVLDIGCGTGRLLNRLGRQYPDMKGIGLDASPQMLQQARRSIQIRPRLIFIQGQSDRLPFAQEEFDAVFCTISFLHYPNPECVFKEIYRVLKRQGVFYLVDYLPGFLWPSWGASGVLGGELFFYSEVERDRLGEQFGFLVKEHVHLLSPVVLSQFEKK